MVSTTAAIKNGLSATLADRSSGAVDRADERGSRAAESTGGAAKLYI